MPSALGESMNVIGGLLAGVALSLLLSIPVTVAVLALSAALGRWGLPGGACG
jgi:hypothetical protein